MGTWRRGVVAGVIGAGVVALWFLLIDLFLGRPLFTPGALGSAFLLGARELGMVEVNALTVGGYTLVHLLAFGALGIAASVIISRARRAPHVIFAGLLLFTTAYALFLGLLAILAQFLLGALGWWTIAVGTLLGVGAMGAFLWTTDSELHYAVEKDPFRGRA